MMNFIKKQGIGFYLSLGAAVLSIISLIIYLVNSTTLYYNDLSGAIVALAVLPIVCFGAVLALNQFEFAKNKWVKLAIDAVMIVAAVLLIWGAIAFVGDRVESFGYIFGSNLELGNDLAFKAGGQAITGIIFFFITWLVACVAAFFSILKKAN